jgi:type II secretory pathway pseudopilin PulG
MKLPRTLRERAVSTPIWSRMSRAGSECRSGRRLAGSLGSEGFTVVELLSALVIAAILIGAAAPSVLGLIRGSRLNAGTRQVISEIRAVQSMAVTRGDIFGFHWGGDPLVGMATSIYRFERDPTGACGWPAPAATAATNPDVIRDWRDLSIEYPGVTITAVQDNGGNPLGGLMFNPQGASVNTCTAVNFPLTVTIADGSGNTRTIQIRSAGSARIL